jgi:hypothetical protein
VFFDYQGPAKRVAIPEEKLERLERQIREEFPHDEMMFELHMLRAILAVERGDATIDEILGPVQVS